MIGLSSEIPLVSHTDVTSPFRPSGNEGYTCNRDVHHGEVGHSGSDCKNDKCMLMSLINASFIH